ncbi:hypothetical protein SERLA73DRAFT_186018 [Serpula lacrymans var. lacrymans S7.3]|uniref:Uncharacterized protein n=2 Tax=Serpula lacrymans var. lacrymans TaxID=341189 RepID=F8Q6T9_SERL3|nr:uncharacterized protein SERLADRAFT_474856 [Serpula lacrymans var. lacrymans S7.9]EGN96327.1 hypothetical protein SERLA73DRAFT_186018 [Serpula lacrymans var. lacrymans S7.3]EGO21866.1 hypothetical protein SERLADRAFT_474856 [Serpula lacrymans var. lacrymans S7.9]
MDHGRHLGCRWIVEMIFPSTLGIFNGLLFDNDRIYSLAFRIFDVKASGPDILQAVSNCLKAPESRAGGWAAALFQPGISGCRADGSSGEVRLENPSNLGVGCDSFLTPPSRSHYLAISRRSSTKVLAIKS